LEKEGIVITCLCRYRIVPSHPGEQLERDERFVCFSSAAAPLRGGASGSVGRARRKRFLRRGLAVVERAAAFVRLEKLS
jgi:hypothetical protein